MLPGKDVRASLRRAMSTGAPSTTNSTRKLSWQAPPLMGAIPSTVTDGGTAALTLF